MASLKELYKKLERYKDFEIDDNDQKFLEVVDRVVEFHDPNSIEVLFKYFDDEDRSWVLESLKGIIKSPQYLTDEEFTIAVLKNVNVLMNKAKNWAVDFFYIIFNVPSCLSTLKNNMQLVKRKHLQEILNQIYNDSEDHRLDVSRLRRLL
jgi:hypothetical protein